MTRHEMVEGKDQAYFSIMVGTYDTGTNDHAMFRACGRDLKELVLSVLGNVIHYPFDTESNQLLYDVNSQEVFIKNGVNISQRPWLWFKKSVISIITDVMYWLMLHSNRSVTLDDRKTPSRVYIYRNHAFENYNQARRYADMSNEGAAIGGFSYKQHWVYVIKNN